MLSQAGFVGLIVERIIDQLKRGSDVPAIPRQGFLDFGRCIAQNSGDLRACFE